MNNPIALALLIEHESRTTFSPDRQRPRRVAPAGPTPSLVARITTRLRPGHGHPAGAAA